MYESSSEIMVHLFPGADLEFDPAQNGIDLKLSVTAKDVQLSDHDR